MLLHVTVAIGVLFTTVWTVKPNYNYAEHTRKEMTDRFGRFISNAGIFTEDVSYKETLYSGGLAHSPHRIKKRGLSRTVRGALAVWRLLRKTKTLPSTSKRYRNHARKGNYMTALRDFFELDPAKVKQTTGKWGRVYEGRIGDKTIILRSKGEYPPHEPELIINDRKAQHFESGTQYSDWIIYKQNIDDL